MQKLPEKASDLTLPEYHLLIIKQREEQHKEIMAVYTQLAYSINDIVKALIIRNERERV